MVKWRDQLWTGKNKTQSNLQFKKIHFFSKMFSPTTCAKPVNQLYLCKTN